MEDAYGMLKHIPNLLTLLRMLLIPWIALALFHRAYGQAAVLFALAAASDGVDGFLARRFGWRTRLGAILDPLADKAMVLAAMLALVADGLLPLWLLLLLLLRDAGIVAGAAYYNHAIHGGFVPRPLLVGKLHVFLVVILILSVIAAAWQGWVLGPWRDGLVALVALSTLASGYAYYRQWRALPR